MSLLAIGCLGIIFNSSDDITLVAGLSFNKLVMRALPVASSPVGSLTGVMNGTSSGGAKQSLRSDPFSSSLESLDVEEISVLPLVDRKCKRRCFTKLCRTLVEKSQPVNKDYIN